MRTKFPRIGKEQRFGRLTTKRIVKSNRWCEKVWECICDCGELTPVTTGHLNSGHTQSCGCLRDETRGNLSRKRPYEFLYSELCFRAARSGKEVSITYDDFLEFVRVKECHYCGKELVWTKFSCENGVETAAIATNLDRIDSKQGYHKPNLVPCCPNCNRGKSDCFSYEEWCVMTSALRAYWKRP